MVSNKTETLKKATAALKKSTGAQGVIVIGFYDLDDTDKVQMLDAAVGTFPAPLAEIFSALTDMRVVADLTDEALAAKKKALQ